MKKKLLFWLIAIPVLVFLIFTVGSIIFLEFFYTDTNEFPYTSWQPREGNYLFNPETVFDSLNDANLDEFTPTYITVYESPQIVPDGTINWTQSDFLMIAETVNQKTWNDTLNNWEIYSLHYSAVCHENLIGFEESHIIYFKTQGDNKYSYTVREFFINPKIGLIEWGGGAHGSSHLFSHWKGINPNQPIEAEDVLRIAEENGGKEFRSTLNNNCVIDLFLAPENGYVLWMIDYTDINFQEYTVFSISVDPFTGKITRIW